VGDDRHDLLVGAGRQLGSLASGALTLLRQLDVVDVDGDAADEEGAVLVLAMHSGVHPDRRPVVLHAAVLEADVVRLAGA
jgi:hypothetical protein